MGDILNVSIDLNKFSNTNREIVANLSRLGILDEYIINAIIFSIEQLQTNNEKLPDPKEDEEPQVNHTTVNGIGDKQFNQLMNVLLDVREGIYELQDNYSININSTSLVEASPATSTTQTETQPQSTVMGAESNSNVKRVELKASDSTCINSTLLAKFKKMKSGSND